MKICIRVSHVLSDGVVSADAGTVLLVLLTALADVGEALLGAQYRAPKPHRVPLHDILAHRHGDLFIRLLLRQIRVPHQALAHPSLQTLLQALVEALKQGGAP